ncbi:hypothetical protein THAOC_36791, partial [Thalassiosira oceanica]
HAQPYPVPDPRPSRLRVLVLLPRHLHDLGVHHVVEVHHVVRGLDPARVELADVHEAGDGTVPDPDEAPVRLDAGHRAADHGVELGGVVPRTRLLLLAAAGARRVTTVVVAHGRRLAPSFFSIYLWAAGDGSGLRRSAGNGLFTSLDLQRLRAVWVRSNSTKPATYNLQSGWLPTDHGPTIVPRKWSHRAVWLLVASTPPGQLAPQISPRPAITQKDLIPRRSGLFRHRPAQGFPLLPDLVQDKRFAFLSRPDFES